MKITFEKVRWRNLLSTGNLWTEIDLRTHRTTLIVGENGAGKSTFLDAICFCLFNKPFRKVNKPQLVNSITRKECVIEVEFRVRGSHFKIVRGIKPAIFEIWKDGTLINQDAASRDYQEYLEKQILRVNHKTFCQIVIWGSASFVPFMQLKPYDRRAIIEDLLDLQIFTTMNSILKTRQSVTEDAMGKFESAIAVTEERLKLTKKHTAQLTEEKEKQIHEREEKINSLEEKIQEQDALIHTLMEEIKVHQDCIKDKEKKEKALKDARKIESQLTAKIEALYSECTFLQKHDNCPTCEQVIDEIFKKTRVDEKLKEREETLAGRDQLQAKITEYELRLSNISEVEKKINKANQDIYVATTNKKHYSISIQDLEDEIARLSEEKSEIIDEGALIMMETELNAMKSTKADLVEEDFMMKYVATLLKDTGIKARIIKQYIPVINKLINKYLASFDFFVDFNLDENFEETIKSRYRDDFTYHLFSEGEKMRIDLSVLFTWRAIAKMRASINTNLLIMDEVLDGSLDYSANEEFLKLVTKLTDDNNVFIISHKTDAISDKFDHMIKFEKVKNFSRMVE